MKLLNKIFAGLFKRKSNSQKNIKLISNSIKLSPCAEGTAYERPDDYSQNELELRIRELNRVLELAASNTTEFSRLLECAKNKESDNDAIKNIADQIISCCDQISLNGLKLLAGDEIGLKIRDESINIKLPDSAARGFGLPGGAALFDAERELEDLKKAIKLSQEEIARYNDKLKVSRHNMKSAGIDLSTVESLIQ
jgi:hypothetical protein